MKRILLAVLATALVFVIGCTKNNDTHKAHDGYFVWHNDYYILAVVFEDGAAVEFRTITREPMGVSTSSVEYSGEYPEFGIKATGLTLKGRFENPDKFVADFTYTPTQYASSPAELTPAVNEVARDAVFVNDKDMTLDKDGDGIIDIWQ